MHLLLSVLTTVLAMQTSLGAQTALSGPEKRILEAYIAATRAGDGEKIRTLMHPQISACMTPENKDYYDAMFARLARLPVPEQYDLKVEPVDPAAMQKRLAFFWGPDSTLPVMPQKEITIHYSQKDDSPQKGCKKFHLVADKDVTHSLDIVESNGKVSMVVGCVGPKTLEMFRQKPKLEAESAVRAKSLLGAMTPESKARLASLIKAGQTLSAVKAYQEESKQSLTEAMNVMDQLCEEM